VPPEIHSGALSRSALPRLSRLLILRPPSTHTVGWVPQAGTRRRSRSPHPVPPELRSGPSGRSAAEPSPPFFSSLPAVLRALRVSVVNPPSVVFPSLAFRPSRRPFTPRPRRLRGESAVPPTSALSTAVLPAVAVPRHLTPCRSPCYAVPRHAPTPYLPAGHRGRTLPHTGRTTPRPAPQLTPKERSPCHSPGSLSPTPSPSSFSLPLALSPSRDPSTAAYTPPSASPTSAPMWRTSPGPRANATAQSPRPNAGSRCPTSSSGPWCPVKSSRAT